MRHASNQIKPHLDARGLKRAPQAHQPLGPRPARIVRPGHPIPPALAMRNLPRLEIRGAHDHVHGHARHRSHVGRGAEARVQIARADPPVAGRVQQRHGARGADRDGPQPVRVQQQEAVGKVAAARVADETEAWGAEAVRVGGADLVDDGEEGLVVADGAFGYVFIAVAVVVAEYVGGEEGG